MSSATSHSFGLGNWVMVLGVPVAVLFIWRRRRDDCASPVAALAVIFMVHLSLFLVLIHVKTINYMIAIWPLAAILLAWLGVRLWDERGTLTRVALAAAIAAIAWEGGARLVATARAAESMTPHDFFAAQVERCIPPGSLVLGCSTIGSVCGGSPFGPGLFRSTWPTSCPTTNRYRSIRRLNTSTRM